MSRLAITDSQRAAIDEARKYLETGGIGETIGLAYAALQSGAPKVAMDTDMAIALCQLAAERDHNRRMVH